MRNYLLLWGSLWHTIYMKHSKCHIRQSQNIQYSKRIVHRRKHPVMVVNAENISRLMDYAGHVRLNQNEACRIKNISVDANLSSKHAFPNLVKSRGRDINIENGGSL